jgi:hypothetical protein
VWYRILLLNIRSTEATFRKNLVLRGRDLCTHLVKYVLRNWRHTAWYV